MIFWGVFQSVGNPPPKKKFHEAFCMENIQKHHDAFYNDSKNAIKVLQEAFQFFLETLQTDTFMKQLQLKWHEKVIDFFQYRCHESMGTNE